MYVSDSTSVIREGCVRRFGCMVESCLSLLSSGYVCSRNNKYKMFRKEISVKPPQAWLVDGRSKTQRWNKKTQAWENQTRILPVVCHFVGSAPKCDLFSVEIRNIIINIASLQQIQTSNFLMIIRLLTDENLNPGLHVSSISQCQSQVCGVVVMIGSARILIREFSWDYRQRSQDVAFYAKHRRNGRKYLILFFCRR